MIGKEEEMKERIALARRVLMDSDILPCISFSKALRGRRQRRSCLNSPRAGNNTDISDDNSIIDIVRVPAHLMRN